jgi:serine protease Do
MVRVCGVVALLFGLASPSSARADEPKHRDLLEAFQKQLATATAAAGPSIACVVVSRSEYYPKDPSADKTPGKLGGFNPKAFLKNGATPERIKLARSLDLADQNTIPDHSYAGGIVIDASGLILTPFHVIEGATRVYVFLPGGVGSYADVLAADARCDLAVLKLIDPPKRLIPIKFADVKIRDQNENRGTVFTGKLVVLMANPYHSTFRLDKPAAAFGTITSLRYRLQGPKLEPGQERRGVTTAEKLSSYYKCGTFLEHDVKVNGGVTGGALLNLDGELIGLTTAGAVVYNREIGPGYAIPADDNFRRLVDVLKKGEEIEYGFLGVSLPFDTQERIRLAGITPNGPAQLGGLREYDTITHINGEPVASFDDLMVHVGSSLAGSRAKFKVTRLGDALDLEVTLAKYYNDRPYIASVRPEPIFGLRVDYASTRTVPVPGERWTQVNMIVPAGVWVRDVVPDSPAANKFETLGEKPEQWTVIRVNGRAVNSPGEFYKAARGLDKVRLALVNPRAPNREYELTLP